MERLRSESKFLGPRGLTTVRFWVLARPSALGCQAPLNSALFPSGRSPGDRTPHRSDMFTRVVFALIVLVSVGLPSGGTPCTGCHASVESVGGSRRRLIGPLDGLGWPNSCAGPRRWALSSLGGSRAAGGLRPVAWTDLKISSVTPH